MGWRNASGMAYWVAGLLGAQACPAAASPPRSEARAETPPPLEREEREIPDLGVVRYRDPARARSLWLGADLGGAAIPGRLHLTPSSVWTVHATGAWAVALTPYLAVGGRHGSTWYATDGVRMRFGGHQLEVSGRPTAASGRQRHRDRLVVGFEHHRMGVLRVDGQDFHIGGVFDAIASVGYGIEHRVSRRFSIGWQATFRHAWVFKAKQRQVRLSLRAALSPRPGHRVAFETTAFYVNRDRDQAGRDLPQHGFVGQFAGDYAFIGKRGLGLAARAQLNTAFRSGEAPVYELRPETLTTVYGELVVGFRAVW